MNELLMTIAMLCQAHAGGSDGYEANKLYEKQMSCQKRLVSCISKASTETVKERVLLDCVKGN